MAIPNETISMAMFCDFENVALGVRDAKYEKFDIKPVLERLLLKGSIVVKKAYCDWDRYKAFKAAMHEANFELIEIPHVRQSGKNSADIRMVVDALDLCYTKSHVNTFVIVSGDSDFSPLVSKLRENAKYVIGVGIKQSTSDLLIANCDEFIFYDDLVRESHRAVTRRDPKSAHAMPRLSPEELETRKSEAIELAVATFEALTIERGESDKIWASMLKVAMKRRKPDFNENHCGFRSFGNLLEEAQTRGLLDVGRDEKSGAYVSRISAPVLKAENAAVAVPEPVEPAPPVRAAQETKKPKEPREPKALREPVEKSPEGAAAQEKRRGQGQGKKPAGKTGRKGEPAAVPAEAQSAAAPLPSPMPAEVPSGVPVPSPVPETAIEQPVPPVAASPAAAAETPSGADAAEQKEKTPAKSGAGEAAEPKRANPRNRRPRKPKETKPAE